MEEQWRDHTVEDASSARCLSYCSLPYSGQGWPQTCVSVLSRFRAEGLDPVLALPRASAEVPETIRVSPALSFPLSRLPWRYVAGIGAARLESHFAKLIDRAEPHTTIAYFWPGAPPALVHRARQRGIMTVREMINSYLGTAKVILDAAYERAGLAATHAVTEQRVEAERAELAQYDYIFASNPEVENSLQDAGVARDRVLPTSFGWAPSRLRSDAPVRASHQPLRVLFVGSVSVRKGIPELLAAWTRSGVSGELILVGDVEAPLRPLLDSAVTTGSVRQMPYSSNIGDYYRSSDIFVFPTLEEGGPQVTLEAAGSGLPVITTPMGAARLVEDGKNGLVVAGGDVDALAGAIARLAADEPLRRRMGARARLDAERFSYDTVSAARARTLMRLLAERV